MSKPIITVREVSPFGDITPEDVSKLAGVGQDRYFLPGYSDKRRDRELAIRKGETAPGLKHRFHLVPVAHIDGRPIAKGVADKRQEGYRPVKADECKALGVDITNTSFHVATDGTVMNGDSLLMVTDARHAAANYVALARRNEALQDAPRARMEQATDAYNSKHGLDSKTGTSAIFEVEQPK